MYNNPEESLIVYKDSPVTTINVSRRSPTPGSNYVSGYYPDKTIDDIEKEI